MDCSLSLNNTARCSRGNSSFCDEATAVGGEGRRGRWGVLITEIGTNLYWSLYEELRKSEVKSQFLAVGNSEYGSNDLLLDGDNCAILPCFPTIFMK